MTNMTLDLFMRITYDRGLIVPALCDCESIEVPAELKAAYNNLVIADTHFREVCHDIYNKLPLRSRKMIKYIRPFHGTLSTETRNVLDKIAVCDSIEDCWVYDGSLDDFATQYGEKFMAMPDHKRNVMTLYVTNRPTFS